MKLFLSVAIQRTSILGGIKVAAIVGTLINLINQGGPLITLQYDQVSMPKLLLTFCIPFCVSIYNSTITRIRYDPGIRAIAAASLTCKTCDHKIDVREGDRVPDCPHCAQSGKRNRWSQEIKPKDFT